MSDVRSLSPNAELGTLLWIGDPTIPEFRDSFEYCVSRVAQFALRTDLDEALRRPAAGVRCILLSRATRRPIEQCLLDRLSELYPRASILNLMGTLCEGMCISEDHTPGANRLYWHRWNQVLPQWLAPCGVAQAQPTKRSSSVAVLAATFAGGEPLLDLAESAGATAVWCQGPDTLRVRNVDAVWWDDSLASPTSSRRWCERIAAFGASGRRSQHAWIANSPRYDQQRQATQGGIDIVISKPHRIEGLLHMLAGGDVTQCDDSHATLKAA